MLGLYYRQNEAGLMHKAHDAHTINQLHFSGANFWYVCHVNLEQDSSGTRLRRRLEQCSIPSHLTEMMTCDWSMIMLSHVMLWSYCVQCCYLLLLYLIFSDVHFGTRNFHSRCTQNEKPVPKTSRKMELIYGAGFWSVCHGPKTLKTLKSLYGLSLLCCESWCCEANSWLIW